jgi:hypothetical protein
MVQRKPPSTCALGVFNLVVVGGLEPPTSAL